LSGRPLDPRIKRGLEAQMRGLHGRLDAGERRLGWKIALNDPRVQQALRIPAPVIGSLATGTQVTSGEGHSLAGATMPAVEPEIAVHVGDDGAIAGLGPALEVIDVNMPFEDLERILEHNVFHRAVVLGPMTAGLTAVEGLGARFLRNGREEHAIDVSAAAMDLDEVVALVAGLLSAVGESLRPGDTIIAGSLVTALPAAAGERFELQVDRLGAVELSLT
jgi:2-keto-4-pentenoate hydratase